MHRTFRSPIPYFPILLVIVPVVSVGCRGAKPVQKELVLYSDPDLEMSDRVTPRFTRETSIKLNQIQSQGSGSTTFDRIIAEQGQPKADVYWSSDPIYCEILRQRGFTTPSRPQSQIPAAFRDQDQHWTGLAARARVLLVGKELGSGRPRSIRAYADPAWHGKGALADPLRGRTRSHFAALGAIWGDEELAIFYHALLKNETRITKDTRESAQLVTAGKAAFAVVDLDDALVEVEKGKVEIVYPDQGDNEPGALFIPGAVTIMKSCKEQEAAQKFVEFLTEGESELRIVRFAPYLVPLQAGVAKFSIRARSPETLRSSRFDYGVAAQKLLQMETILGLVK